MSEHFAQAAIEYAATFECRAFASASWPLLDDKIMRIEGIGQHILGSGEFVFILHKDDVRAEDYAIYLSMAGRSTVVYANAVYVLFHVRSTEYYRNDVKSLYLKAAEARAIRPTTSVVLAPHFCCYMGDNTLLTATDFGRKLYVDSNDISLSPHLAYEGKWEPHVTAFVRKHLRNGQTFIDIGANCGFYTVLAAHLVGPSGFVLALEPQRRLVELLHKSVAVNGFGCYTAVKRIAIGEKRDEMGLSHAGSYLGSASLISFEALETELERVVVAPLDEVVKEVEVERARIIAPDIIKIDVEGFEPLVWRGAKAVLERTAIVLLEFSPARYRQIGIDPDFFLNEISTSGFLVNRLGSDGELELVGPTRFVEILTSPDYTDLVLTR